MSQINYSEFQALAQCERRWWYQYNAKDEEERTFPGMQLGTLCHLWYGRWLTGHGATLPEVWTDDISSGGKPSAELQSHALEDFPIELVERAQWLAKRFVACYGESPPSSWTVISAEEWMTRPFGDDELVGRCDGVVTIDDKLWLIELKTYSSKPGPLAYAQVSPQLGCYGLLVEHKYGTRPWGIIYQGIYTYQWKPKVPTQADLIEDAKAGIVPEYMRFEGMQMPSKASEWRDWARSAQAKHPGIERPVEDSFEQIEVDLGPEHYYTASGYLGAAIERRNELALWSAADTIANVGAGCRGCGHRQRCWSEMGGVEEFEIEVEDDEEEGAEPR